MNVPGFNSLADQGLLRKPRAIKVGVLHDWVELDGVFYSFEKDNNDAATLERALNERYLSNVAFGQGKDIVAFANAASSTGFDIEFTALIGGVPDHRRRPLNEDTLELLQDPNKCGLLQHGLVIKLTRPALIFKQKTHDGGERYLAKCPENCVVVRSDTETERIIDLSQPVNYLRLSAVELTAVFSHPTINKHGKAAAAPSSDINAPQIVPVAETPHTNATEANQQIFSLAAESEPAFCIMGKADQEESWMNTDPGRFHSEDGPDTGTPVKSPGVGSEDAALGVNPISPDELLASDGGLPGEAAEARREALPNIWLKEALEQPSIRFDWFTCLVYDQMAEHFGNSQQGELGPMNCWAVALGETEDVAAPSFKGIFLTEKHGLGFINQGHMIRFYKGVVFIGNQDSALEGIGINLVGMGVDRQERIVFIVREEYLDKFDVAEQVLKSELTRLPETGAGILTIAEALRSPIPFNIVWTVPADQQNPSDPQAVTSLPANVF